MTVSIILALIIAKLKKYRLKYFIKAWSFYPFIMVELIYIFMQVLVFSQNYTFLKYAPYLKSAYLYTLIIPIFVYKLYKPAVIGSASILIGTGLNRLVMYVNGGKMPVYPTLSLYTGYYNEKALAVSDGIHCAGTAETSLKLLSDYIDVGWSILSIGDLFIHAFAFIIIYSAAVKLNSQPIPQQ